MTYVSAASAQSILNDPMVGSGVRELARAYLELLADMDRVCALGERWMEGGPETKPYGRRLFDAVNDEEEDDVDGIAPDDVADEDQGVAEVGAERPALALVTQVHEV
ncbi:hypothetical protein ACIQI7_38630 [Kitasatospora sp. NPDC092039]|uniref:hypothetical protein n=1 Tax=Kitasatospora sp. NPDC092039 TaxID=3364086 RepID=UPI00380AEE7B